MTATRQTKEGYEPVEKQINRKELLAKRHYHAGNFYLIKERKVKNLDALVVKATKIKMLYKGDTIVYNADAFNVSQLDKLKVLVAQLPGASFEKGVLRVNGRIIDNMTISGKDFFNGNINAVLENLPAYIVSKLKVYEKSGEMSELTGRDMHDKLYVMDVKLKREYIGNWIAKLEANAGTAKLWGGQGFLMRMDDRQMFSTHVDANNFNERREMTEMGDMSEQKVYGRSSYGIGRANYFFQPDDKWRIRANASIEQEKMDISQSSHTQTFLQPYDLMSRSKREQVDKLRSIKSFAALRYRKQKQQHELSYDYSFKRTNFLKDNTQLSWYKGQEANPLLNLLSPNLQQGKEHQHKLSLASAMGLGMNLLKTNIAYQNKLNRYTFFQNYALNHYIKGEQNWQRQYKDSQNQQHNLSFRADYDWRIIEEEKSNGGIKPFLSSNYLKSKATRQNYRLDWLEDFQPTDWTAKGLGLLPEGDFQLLTRRTLMRRQQVSSTSAAVRSFIIKGHLSRAISLTYQLS